jgi:hypothetical protein
MIDYIFLMHDDAPKGGNDQSDYDWGPYIAKLQGSGHFSGGSAIGAGECINKSGVASRITSYLSGYIRVQAESLSQAKSLLNGNPVFEAGGTVEIRELPRG